MEEQTHPARSVLVDGAHGDALRRALATDAEWIWVLDGSAVPRRDALARLLAGLERVDGIAQPSLLAGVVRTDDGRFDEGRGLWYRHTHIEPAMAAAGSRLLPIRASAGPALVHRDAVRAVPPRRHSALSPRGVLDLTARILRTHVGYLVPESASDALAPVRVDGPAVAARLILGGAFTGFDRARIGYELAQRAGRAISGAGSGSRRARL